MASLTGLITIKQFPYRGDPGEEFSNTFHFRDAPPSTSADWKTMADAFIVHEKAIYPSTVHVVRAYGYDTDDAKPVSVWSYDYLAAGEQVAGTLLQPAASTLFAGDQAAMIEWQLDHKNTRGKWVYLRKYVHSGYVSNTAPDDLATNYHGALQTFADALAQSPGAFHGGLRARTGTWPIQDWWVGNHVTTRTLHRRGKRPPLAA